jgi:hypothetical protein
MTSTTPKKTYQDVGWTYEKVSDGVVEVTRPDGVIIRALVFPIEALEKATKRDDSS